MPLRDDLLNPIPGPNPSGINLRYDPVTDKIKEARREEMEGPQGDWKTAVKLADYPLVVKLAGEALATRSKDLQIAVWMIDALVRREGFAVLTPSFRLLHDLCLNFWDTIYPEIDDGDDLELRAVPLDWLGGRLEEPIRLVPVTSNGLSFVRYNESRTVGYEAQADNAEKKKKREQALSEGKIAAEEFDAALDATPKAFYEERLASVESALGALEELSTLLDEKFGSFSPSFLKTRTALEDSAHLLQSAITKKGGPTVARHEETTAEVAPPHPSVGPVPVLSPPPSPPQPVPPAPAPATPPAVQPIAVPSPATIDPSDQDDAIKRLAAVARYLRVKDMYDISPYLILRGFRWGEIRYNGPDIDRSMLSTPGDEVRDTLAKKFADADWDGVLALTEAVMETAAGRGWLDVQRFTVKALEKKGPYFSFVAGAVLTGVRGLLQDLPTLADLAMRDGRPTADSETREWIESEVLAGPLVTQPQAPAPPEPPPVTPEPPKPLPPPLPPIELAAKPPQLQEESLSENASGDVFEEALHAAQNGRLPDALKLLRDRLNGERSGRGRFRRRVQLAHLLVAAGQLRVALPMLEELAQEIENRQLEYWEEAEALAYPIDLLLRCSTGDPEKRSRLYAALCRLDPVRAMLIEI